MAAPSRVASDGRVCVAQIGGAHGVRGEVRLKSFTQDPMAAARYGPLQAEDGRSLEITAARPGKDALIVRFKGVDERNAAEALRLVKLYVAREQLGDVEEDEFFHADLIGLAAVHVSGAPLGTVIAVQNFGAGDLLEIAPADGSPSLLLPFTKAVVPAIDVAARTIIVDPPAGLIDETSATHTALPSPPPQAAEEVRRR